ncbi:type II secretion system protein [Iamia majanohamensis]|uniref:Type II secretion system protein n=1 Tax=Iamia majanohamensis TaxID=467976 RepID=A0AAE9Y5K5_9ACTN|nr:type II secretion system protein [Iamia majanohamensis]WCO66837.1 type II secretion system protein [Iamia majanohamensis]
MLSHVGRQPRLAPPRRTCRQCRCLSSQAGFTMIELLVAIVLLGLIMGPLGLAFYSTVQGTERVSDSLTASTSREQLAAYFTGDVASVDATGVSTDPARGCKPSSVPGAAELLVSLNATTVDASGTSTRRASYWITGSGTDIGLTRAVCDGVSPTSASTSGRALELVQAVGDSSSLPASTIFGAVEPPGTEVCDEFACAIEVDGRFGYIVKANRRVFGAGVPLEVGKVYSSTSLTYPLATATGAPAGTELPWGGRISLAPGLDGPSNLTVEVAIQQAVADAPLPPANSGGYFYNPGSAGATTFGRFDYTPGPNPPPSNAWFSMSYDGSQGQWYTDLPISQITRGGEYRIWTRLTPDGGATKDYGGSSGFPLWFDWRPGDAIWVSNGDGTATRPYIGNNANSGTVPSQAVATVAEGLRKSGTAQRPQVLVMNNDGAGYGPLTVSGAGFPANRVVTGGLDPVYLLRRLPQIPTGALPAVTGSEAYSGTSTIRGNKSQFGTGAVVDGVQGLTLRHMYVDAGTLADSHPTSYGMRVLGGATTTLQRSFVRARDGRDGTPGANGADAPNACWGLNGTVNSTSTTSGAGTPANPANGSNRDTTCNTSANPERSAGSGGGGGDANFLGTGDDGVDGLPGGTGASGGTGGEGGEGRGGGSGGENGKAGGGVQGVAKVGGAGRGAITVDTIWTSGPGGNGAKGNAGLGGGGSGGGGGNWYATGNSGGAGGQGGEGGGGGGGGVSGGSSFGVYVFGTGSTVTVDAASRVQAGDGGDGGAGGVGGLGGAGGKGGSGASRAGDGGGESAGGGGGGGGGGGASGAGGNGGWSVALQTNVAGGVTAASGADLVAGTKGNLGASNQKNHPGLPGNPQNPGIPAFSGNGGPGGGGGAATQSGLAVFGWTFYTTRGDAGPNGSRGPAADPSLPGFDGRACGTQVAALATGGTCTP